MHLNASKLLTQLNTISSTLTFFLVFLTNVRILSLMLTFTKGCHGHKSQGQNSLAYWIDWEATIALKSWGSVMHQYEPYWNHLTLACPFLLTFTPYHNWHLLLLLSHTLYPSLACSVAHSLRQPSPIQMPSLQGPLSIQQQTQNKSLGNHITVSIWTSYWIRSANTQL